MRERWLSRRAVFLHVGALLFVPFCVVATWWQITRAEDGNGLSYLYTFEWPVFALLGIYFWWQFLHIDYEAVGLRGMRNQAVIRSASMTDSPTATGLTSAVETPTSAKTTTQLAPPPSPTPMQPLPAPSSTSGSTTPPTPGPRQGQDEEDPELAAYNARLAVLASSGEKTWRKPEVHVARRRQ